ncbi:kinase-like domain-containing protein [Thamnocephalis sphaerospora]|uniref:Kinase-like domain-containing protein n=1 Tax=Thamnocephalis sphaerospora TaxID=78915 RepID=A0A4P9XGK8_9FUNG|nr:kinase-like domain-containing protein [Thamnocephalis sphaerospora]|eukprot:RKP04361.1 kinase-like domain-containing protein [Thamnocephalis sphaerospora]
MHLQGWVHGDIKPENIFVRRSASTGTIKVTLIDFDLSQRPGNKPRRTRGSTLGYQPPEDFLNMPLDQYARDSWMLGATIYVTLTDKLPYGVDYDETRKVYRRWSDRKLSSTMLHIGATGTNTFPPIRTSKNQHLLGLMNKLMTCKVRDRPTIVELGASLVSLVSWGDKPSSHVLPVLQKAMRSE